MDNVITFEVLTEYATTRRKIKQIRECKHSHIVLNEERMECICQDCGAIIHPFWILLEYADGQRRTKKTAEAELRALEAAKKEFEEIQAGWSFTLTEKRRIGAAMNKAR